MPLVDVKTAQKSKVAALLIALTVVFGVLYLPDEVLRIFSIKMEKVASILAKLGVTFTVSTLTFWILFSIDHLATGKGLKSCFFRHYYPSTYAVKHCGMSREAANTAWFEYFNQWADEKHPHHEQYVYSFERSYACRLIYYLIPLLIVLLVAGAVSIVVCTITIGTAPSLLVVQIVVWLVAAGAAIWLYRSNGVRDNGDNATYENRYDATGVYYQYKEIEGILRSLFCNEVLQGLCGPAAAPAPTASP
jgi:hypothetical protein